MEISDFSGFPPAPQAKTSRNGNRARGVFEREPGSDVWWIRYADHTGTQRKELAGTKSQARKRKEEVRQVKQGLRLSPEEEAKRNLTLNELVESYWPVFEKKKSAAWDRRHADKWCEELGKMRIGEIQPGDIEKVRDSWLSEIAPSTTNRRLTFLKTLFNKAARDRALADLASLMEERSGTRYFSPRYRGRRALG